MLTVRALRRSCTPSRWPLRITEVFCTPFSWASCRHQRGQQELGGQVQPKHTHPTMEWLVWTAVACCQASSGVSCRTHDTRGATGSLPPQQPALQQLPAQASRYPRARHPPCRPNPAHLCMCAEEGVLAVHRQEVLRLDVPQQLLQLTPASAAQRPRWQQWACCPYSTAAPARRPARRGQHHAKQAGRGTAVPVGMA